MEMPLVSSTNTSELVLSPQTAAFVLAGEGTTYKRYFPCGKGTVFSGSACKEKGAEGMEGG